MEFKRFVPDHCLQQLFCWLKIIPCPIKRIFALWLRFLIMQSLEVWVLQALFYGVSFFRIKNKHLSKQIQGHRVGFWVKRCPGLLVSFWQLSNVFPCQVVSNKCHIFMSRCSEHCDSPLDLIKIIVSWEQWCSAQKLSEDTAYGPDIEGVCVVRSIQDDFWCSVPSGHDILCQGCGGFFIASS
jgi:hypothetical protein